MATSFYQTNVGPLPKPQWSNDGVLTDEFRAYETRLYNDAHAEGYAACRAGKSNIDNPYTARGEDGLEEAWNDGWFARCDDEAERAETGDYDF